MDGITILYHSLSQVAAGIAKYQRDAHILTRDCAVLRIQGHAELADLMSSAALANRREAAALAERLRLLLQHVRARGWA